jgi:hypothetical protein
MKQEQHGTLTLMAESSQPTETEIRAAVEKYGYKLSVSSVAYVDQSQRRQLEFRLEWRSAPNNVSTPAFLVALSADPHILSVIWKMV